MATSAHHHDEPAPLQAGAREHEGWYLRFATGFSGYQDMLHTSTIDAMITGVGSASELALGGTVGRGVVLGGGIYSVGVLAWSLKADDPDFVLPRDLDPTLSSFNLVGPFLDIYPDPHKGFHIQAALGLAVLMGNKLEANELNFDLQGLGGGLMLGIGHEWWIDDQWSFGVLGRAMVGYVRSRDEADVGWGHIVSTTPGVLATFTYH